MDCYWQQLMKSALSDEIKREFFQAVAVLELLYGYTTWTLTKRLKKKFDGNYKRIQEAGSFRITAV